MPAGRAIGLATKTTMMIPTYIASYAVKNTYFEAFGNSYIASYLIYLNRSPGVYFL